MASAGLAWGIGWHHNGLECLDKSLDLILEASDGSEPGGTLWGLCPKPVTLTAGYGGSAWKRDWRQEGQCKGHSSRKWWWPEPKPWEGEVGHGWEDSGAGAGRPGRGK